MADDASVDDQAPDPRLAAEESLNAALNDLQKILDQRSPAEKPEPTVDPLEHSQPSIPLLDNVVVPGIPIENGVVDVETAGRPPMDPPLSANADFRRIVDRLASELDIIIQSRVETAMREVSKDIKARIRTHIDIILPEILEELAELDRSR